MDCWGVVTQTLAGSVVELGGDLLDVSSAVHGEVGPFGEVLPGEAVVVLVRAALPGAAPFGEVDRDPAGLVSS